MVAIWKQYQLGISMYMLWPASILISDQNIIWSYMLNLKKKEETAPSLKNRNCLWYSMYKWRIYEDGRIIKECHHNNLSRHCFRGDATSLSLSNLSFCINHIRAPCSIIIRWLFVLDIHICKLVLADVTSASLYI